MPSLLSSDSVVSSEVPDIRDWSWGESTMRSVRRRDDKVWVVRVRVSFGKRTLRERRLCTYRVSKESR